VELFGVTLLGIGETGHNILLSLAVLGIAALARIALGLLARFGLKQLLPRRMRQMGETPPEQRDPPAQWVNGRQFSGRVVTVSNSVAFDQPVYNYTRDFPYTWEALTLAFRYDIDRAKAEKLMLDTTRRYADDLIVPARRALQHLEDRYYVEDGDTKPRTYWRLDEKCPSITVRFLTSDRDNREIKDTIGRELLQAFDREGIQIGTPA
jgi:hypothetical protein